MTDIVQIILSVSDANFISSSFPYCCREILQQTVNALLRFIRSPAAVEKLPGRDKETVTSRLVTDVDNRSELHPPALDDHPVSTPTATSADKSISGLSGDARAAEVVRNGHVTNMASNFRLPSRRVEDGERAPLAATSSKEDTDRHPHYQRQHQQQEENHAGTQYNSHFPNRLKTVKSINSTPDDSLVHSIQQKQQRQQHDAQQNFSPSNCSRTVSSTEKTRITENHLHSTHNQQQQQQQQQRQGRELQNLRSQPLISSNTINLTQKRRTADDQSRYSLEHRHHCHEQQERQRNAASKNWSNCTTTALTELTRHDTRRPTLPPAPVFRHQNPAAATTLLRTPSAGDGRPAPADGVRSNVVAAAGF